jgi:hypothetical protein
MAHITTIMEMASAVVTFCNASAGTGVLWTVAGGVPKSA